MPGYSGKGGGEALSKPLSSQRNTLLSSQPRTATATLSPIRKGATKPVFVGRAFPEFDQDVFLGIKYANEPVRFAPAELPEC